MTLHATRKRDRDRLSVEFLTIYMKEVHGHYATAVAGLAASSGRNLHAARQVGNWFEVFASLIVLGHANGQLVEDSGLKIEMRKFWDAADAAHKNGGRIDPNSDWPKLTEYVT